MIAEINSVKLHLYAIQYNKLILKACVIDISA